jgi:hypothetical protein
VTAPALAPEPEPVRRPTRDEAIRAAAQVWADIVVELGLTAEHPHPQETPPAT